MLKHLIFKKTFCLQNFYVKQKVKLNFLGDIALTECSQNIKLLTIKNATQLLPQFLLCLELKELTLHHSFSIFILNSRMNENEKKLLLNENIKLSMCLTMLEHLGSNPQTRVLCTARTLHTQIVFRWWPLRGIWGIPENQRTSPSRLMWST